MKVFGIGMARTGTKSLNRALRQLGFNVHHYPEDPVTASEVIGGRPYSMLEQCDGLTDLHATVRFRDLDARYPGSKFILTTRERESWLRSCSEHFAYYHSHPEPQPLSSMSRTLHLQAYGVDAFDRDNFVRIYEKHLVEVTEHFKGREESLLLLNIITGEGWEKLCPFLGTSHPKRPFPRTR